MNALQTGAVPFLETRARLCHRGRLLALGTVRPAWLPVLVTYFAYGASGITGVAALYFQKTALALTPADVAHVAFWAALPWSMKMVVGVASDRYPVLGHRRLPYLVAGAACSFAGYVGGIL